MENDIYFNRMESIQKDLLDFIDDQNNSEIDLKKINIDDLKGEEKKDILNETLNIISKISSNHHRSLGFFNKIEQILNHFKDYIKQTFSNSQIFNIFQKNYRILLFLFNENIIKFDDVASLIYSQYFLYEKLSYLNEGPLKLDDSNEQGYKIFEEKRKIGENDSYICSLIRNDSVEEFITYVNRNNISLSSTIKQSIFETNDYLKLYNTTLIEYAAFFGAIQIFEYLNLNNVKLNSELWMYVIHSNNPNLIHILEYNQVEPPNNSYEKCLIESIKCHHNDIANYFIDNYIKKEFDYMPYCIEYYNFALLQKNVNSNILKFIKNGYISIPKMFYNEKYEDINEIMV